MSTHLKVPEGSGALSVDDALGNALAVEVRQVVDKGVILTRQKERHGERGGGGGRPGVQRKRGDRLAECRRVTDQGAPKCLSSRSTSECLGNQWPEHQLNKHTKTRGFSPPKPRVMGGARGEGVKQGTRTQKPYATVAFSRKILGALFARVPLLLLHIPVE